MTLKDLCCKISMPEEVADEILSIETALPQSVYTTAQVMMQIILKYNDPYPGLEEVKKLLAPDERGLKMLVLFLSCACKSYTEYQKLGISDDIYLDSMKCFSRFVKEHKESYSVYGYDREWWNVRQLALRLFRIGELEFEKLVVNGENQIHVHIPSDADIQLSSCKHSIQMAREFFQKYAPDFHGVTYCCESWLLAPVLREFLPESSRILKFQTLFAIDEIMENSNDYKVWIFKNPNLSTDDLPETTSLQKKAKSWLQNGNHIGVASGHLIL